MSHDVKKLTNRIQIGLAAKVQEQIRMPRGITVGMGNSLDLMRDVGNALLEQAFHSSNDSGLQFPKVSRVCSVIPGTSRHVDYFNASLKYLAPPADGLEHRLVSLGTSPEFDFLSNEGQIAMMPILHEMSTTHAPCILMFAQEVDNPQSPKFVEGLMKIRAAAEEVGAYVIGLFACSDPRNQDGLSQLCNEYFMVEECDPDFDQDTAFSIDYVGLRGLNRFGVGKTLCSMRFSENRLTHTYEPFISGDVRLRVMWSMRSAGLSYADIGKAFEENKSTILRKLRKLPAADTRRADKDRLALMLEYLDLDDTSLVQDAEKFVACIDEDDDDYAIEDDEE